MYSWLKVFSIFINYIIIHVKYFRWLECFKLLCWVTFRKYGSQPFTCRMFINYPYVSIPIHLSKKPLTGCVPWFAVMPRLYIFLPVLLQIAPTAPNARKLSGFLNLLQITPIALITHYLSNSLNFAQAISFPQSMPAIKFPQSSSNNSNCLNYSSPIRFPQSSSNNFNGSHCS